MAIKRLSEMYHFTGTIYIDMFKIDISSSGLCTHAQQVFGYPESKLSYNRDK